VLPIMMVVTDEVCACDVNSLCCDGSYYGYSVFGCGVLGPGLCGSSNSIFAARRRCALVAWKPWCCGVVCSS
jgi:hypothetical protein